MRDSFLVADIGGTNARYAIASSQIKDQKGDLRLDRTMSFPCTDFNSLEESLDAYRSMLGNDFPDTACIAVAGPVEQDQVQITNLDWQFSIKQLKQRHGFRRLNVINDFHAQACALAYLQEEKHRFKTIIPGQAIRGAAKLIVGPGTGLGVAALIQAQVTGDQDNTMPVVSEAGNMLFAPSNPLELQILQSLWSEEKHVSLETLLSGSGLISIYRALGRIYGQPTSSMTARAITQEAEANPDSLSFDTVNLFCQILGSSIGGFALAFCSTGGVYLTGGMIPHMLGILGSGEFEKRFKQQGIMSDYVKDVPVQLLNETEPGLLGAAACLLKQYPSN